MREKQLLSVLIAVMIILILPGFMEKSTFDTDDYRWVLVEIDDQEYQEAFQNYNKNNENYDLQGTYGQNQFKIKWTYVGITDTSKEPNMIQGESITFDASFSTPKQVIEANEDIVINMSLSASGNSLSFFTPFASARGQIGKNNSGWGNFSNEDEKVSFKTDSKNNYISYNEVLHANAPSGKGEDRLELRFQLYCGEKLETRYIYEWKIPENQSSEIEESEQAEPTIGDNQPIDPDINNRFNPNVPEGYKDSGARFSDIYGEVLVRRGDDLLGWDAAELDMVICEGDVIKTSYDSGAVLSLDDMTVFYVEEETKLIMDTGPEKESKLKLLAGKIIANVKEMIYDGSMTIEMSQAVAGIKGTTFILEEEDGISSLKVLEGRVEFTPYNQEGIMVDGGETVKVRDGNSSSVVKYSIAEELELLDEGTRASVERILIEEGVNIEENDKDPKATKEYVKYFILLAILLVAGGIYLLFKRFK